MKLDEARALFPDSYTDEQRARAQTLFFKALALKAHRFYGGKMQTIPKAGVWDPQWFNVWYTPGVSAVSTSIRDDQNASYDYSNRGNLVAVVSDSTRVLGDGDCSPWGGLGVMEGKAFLMKYLGGVDAVALCVNNRGLDGRPSSAKLIDFVKMVEPSFGAINLEDISKPNCYEVLDTLRELCEVPVWHDDAQGTACVTLAGLLNALLLAGKRIEEVKTVLLGAGASNTTIARFLLQAGMSGSNMIMFNSTGALHADRRDIEADTREYRQWELCLATNPRKVSTIEEAMRGADVLIALSQPGPDTVKPAWIRSMAEKAIVFACANPVPEIYPCAAREAGAFIVATGRGDFPNQVNNSLGFPGILKGALLARASKITDTMAIRAARALARFAEQRGISPDNIIATMDETEVFPFEAAEVAMQAVADGVARADVSYEEVLQRTRSDIQSARQVVDLMLREGIIKTVPDEMLREAVAEARRGIEHPCVPAAAGRAAVRVK